MTLMNEVREQLEEAFDAYYSTGMNIAQALQTVFDYMECEDGYIVGNREFRQFVNELGTYTEECSESCDSTRRYTFGDGSTASYYNPCQEAFTASFRADW